MIWLRGLDLNQRPSGYEPQHVVCSGALYFSHIFDITQHIKALCDLATPHGFAAILNISRPHDSIVIPLIKPEGPELITKIAP